LDFYSQIRLINYIRVQVGLKSCIMCDHVSKDNQELLSHMEKESHFAVLKDAPFFKDNEYLRPALENDALLLSLETDDFDDNDAQFQMAI